jgi:hypothetical protein
MHEDHRLPESTPEELEIVDLIFDELKRIGPGDGAAPGGRWQWHFRLATVAEVLACLRAVATGAGVAGIDAAIGTASEGHMSVSVATSEYGRTYTFISAGSEYLMTISLAGPPPPEQLRREAALRGALQAAGHRSGLAPTDLAWLAGDLVALLDGGGSVEDIAKHLQADSTAASSDLPTAESFAALAESLVALYRKHGPPSRAP